MFCPFGVGNKETQTSTRRIDFRRNKDYEWQYDRTEALGGGLGDCDLVHEAATSVIAKMKLKVLTPEHTKSRMILEERTGG